jgi:hypothetical protein
VDHFITALHTLSEHCGYGDMRDQLIRDLIVVGICDDKLSEKMQLANFSLTTLNFFLLSSDNWKEENISSASLPIQYIKVFTWIVPSMSPLALRNVDLIKT